jgi:hypothetical protein
MLRGQLQYPDDTAVGDKDGSIEFSMGRQDWNFLNQTFNADITQTGGTSSTSSPATAIPVTPFHITPAIPGMGTYAADLGVYNANGLNQFAKVASGPAAGQYSETAGVYTFSSADNVSGISVIIDFAYTVTAGATYEVNNQIQGYGPIMQAYFQCPYQLQSNVASNMLFYACRFSEADDDFKRTGYGMIAIKGTYFADSQGRVAAYYSNVG